VNPQAEKCFIAGFSFGAWIAMQLLMRRPNLDSFIAVSPSADRYDFSFLAPCPVPGMIIQGAKDDIVPHTYVGKLVEKLQQQRGIKIDYRLVPEADHFYSGHLPILCQHVEEHLKHKPIQKTFVVNQM